LHNAMPNSEGKANPWSDPNNDAMGRFCHYVIITREYFLVRRMFLHALFTAY